MTIYSLYTRAGAAELEAVPDRFSWFAALLPPLYALLHGLWLALLGYVVAVVALVLLSFWIGSEAAGWLYVLFAVSIGFEAATLRRVALGRRGFHYRGEAISQSAELAEVAYLWDTLPTK
jgi:hypothetical protein